MSRVLCSGSLLCDLIAADLPRIGEPGDLVYAPRGISLHAGGHAANVAISLAQLGRSGVAVVGSIGDDIFGGFLEDELKERGVGVYSERIAGTHTAKNLVLVVKGQDRRFIAELSANTLLGPRHVLDALEETNPDIFYQGTVGGLRKVDRDLGTLLDAAKERGTLTVVDVVRPYKGGWDGLKGVYPSIDILHCNCTEAEALTGEKNPAVASGALVEGGIRLALVTMGGRGLIAAWSREKLRLPAFEVKTIDPTGAGDAFCAGIIDAFLRSPRKPEGWSLDQARPLLLEGSAAGAACVTAAGATTAVTRENVDAMIFNRGAEVWQRAVTV
ncbi:MAG: PfkB family carbohydrate kinase [Candidatus Bathyarchaeota archaeon]|jgi:fructokinase